MKPRVHSDLAARQSRAFTLIELLIAITILALIAVLGWRSLDQVMRGKSAIEAALDDEEGLAQVFDQIAIDAEKAVPEYALDGSAIELTDSGFSIVRRVSLSNSGSLWQIVAYRLERGHLVRAGSPFFTDPSLLVNLRAQIWSTPGVVLLDGVGRIKTMLYLPGKGWQSADSLAGLKSAPPPLALAAQSGTMAAPPVEPNHITGLQLAIWRGEPDTPLLRSVLVGP